MTQLANEHNAINLAQGFPTFEPDSRLLARISYHLQNGANQYAPMAGVDELRESIAEKVQRLYGRSVDSDTEITVSDGATEGLFSTILAVVRPGDEVIIFDPAFDSYAPAVILAGGQPRHLPLRESSARPGQHIDYDQLRDSINERTRLIIINFPHNPSGSILNRGDLDTLAEIIRDTSIYLLSDEVYEHIVFDGEQHCSVLTHDELWERSFVVTSFGKTYHATGWKIGYCIAPAALSVEFRRVHQFACYAVVTPIQHALADFMREAPNHYAELSSFYQKKRDHFCNLIKDSRFKHKPAAGTFFQTLDYSGISNESELSYAQRLTREIGVAAIPISVFCKEEPASRVLRFCFAKDDAMLEAAAERLCRL
ncbi:methionine aminotransferase [Woeseia oceani]|uniref:Aminotransferase n=1 Tax=Woeseia oceani TaxID=1548547 RepID=A0A193LGH6_9GAMM|nr:methionine aminotransferase [Woeseia oceani]ANO51566.1 aminotransferase [Woeseia oceani]